MNENRLGFASAYYQDMLDNFTKKTHATRLYVRESVFKMPLHHTIPLMMICTGTGVAPFISFLQELDHSSSNRETFLIFGSKNSKHDFILEEEIKDYLNRGVLKALETAFSRDDPDRKVYVQDKLQESKSIRNLLLEKKGYLYICGGVSMGAQVVRALEGLFSIQFIKEMENEKRIIKELWG